MRHLVESMWLERREKLGDQNKGDLKKEKEHEKMWVISRGIWERLLNQGIKKENKRRIEESLREERTQWESLLESFDWRDERQGYSSEETWW